MTKQPNSIALPYLFVRETQYFGFFPLVFVDRIINVVNEMIYSFIERFYTILYSSEEVHKQLSPFQMEEGLSKVLTLMESAVDKNFDIFELFVLKNIFKFPDTITVNNIDDVCTHVQQKDTISKDTYECDMKELANLEEQWNSKRNHLLVEKLLKNRLEIELSSSNQLLEMVHSIINSWRVDSIRVSNPESSAEIQDFSVNIDIVNKMKLGLTSAHESITKIQSMLHSSNNFVKSFDSRRTSSNASYMTTSFYKWNTKDSSILEDVWQTAQQIASFKDINDVKSSMLIKG